MWDWKLGGVGGKEGDLPVPQVLQWSVSGTAEMWWKPVTGHPDFVPVHFVTGRFFPGLCLTSQPVSMTVNIGGQTLKIQKLMMKD